MGIAAGRGQGLGPEAFFLEFLKNVIQMNCFRTFFTVFVEPISFDTLLRRKSFDTLLRRKLFDTLLIIMQEDVLEKSRKINKKNKLFSTKI